MHSSRLFNHLWITLQLGGGGGGVGGGGEPAWEIFLHGKKPCFFF